MHYNTVHALVTGAAPLGILFFTASRSRIRIVGVPRLPVDNSGGTWHLFLLRITAVRTILRQRSAVRWILSLREDETYITIVAPRPIPVQLEKYGGYLYVQITPFPTHQAGFSHRRVDAYPVYKLALRAIPAVPLDLEGPAQGSMFVRAQPRSPHIVELSACNQRERVVGRITHREVGVNRDLAHALSALSHMRKYAKGSLVAAGAASATRDLHFAPRQLHVLPPVGLNVFHIRTEHINVKPIWAGRGVYRVTPRAHALGKIRHCNSVVDVFAVESLKVFCINTKHKKKKGEQEETVKFI